MKDIARFSEFFGLRRSTVGMLCMVILVGMGEGRVLLFCKSFFWLVFAFILRGLKEFGEPTRKALIMDLAPEEGRT